MQKKYSLDYNIIRDVDRLAAICDILDKLDTDPSPNDLEQMGSYILYGKDENGLNAAQRGEIITGNTRYNSFRRKDDKLLSLDAILDNPLTDQQQFKPSHARDTYTNPKPTIQRPKYDKKTGQMIDPGDSDIPGMTELWECIDHLDHLMQVVGGNAAPDEDTALPTNDYRVYQLKHNLIDLRRHQYYLKDAYKPTIHFQAVDHPKAQFVDWTSDSYYWISYDEWQQRVSKALTHHVSRNIEDYTIRRNNETGEIEVKWIVREHHFDWENPAHVRALINNYGALYDQLYEKLDTYGRTIIFDFERYRELANFSEVREFLINKKIQREAYSDTLQELQQKFGLKYNENHLSTIYSKEIPERFAFVAKRERIINETPVEKRKSCCACGRMLPRDKMFFSRNRSRKDGYSSCCKECEKKRRIERGGQSAHDRRNKETQLLEMQAK